MTSLEAAERLTRWDTSSVADVIVRCNELSNEDLCSAAWIPGWEHPLQKAFARADIPGKPTTV